MSDNLIEKLGRDFVFVGSEKWESASRTCKHHLIGQFAKRGARILYVENISMRRLGSEGGRDYGKIVRELKRFFAGLRSPIPGVHCMNPIYLPFPQFAAARRFNQWFVPALVRFHMRRMGMRDPVLVYFMPTGGTLQGKIGEKLACYYITDNYAAFADVEKATVTQLENEALAKADMVFATAATLAEARRDRRADIVYSPHGVDAEHFATAMDPATEVMPEVARLPKPRIGFMGGLGYDYVDLGMIRDLAKRRREWQFVLVGRDLSDISELVAQPNIAYLGRKPYEELPSFLKCVDVAIIPFLVNSLTRDVNPLKMREYLAAGLPVVATDIPATQGYDGHVKRVVGIDAFEAAIAESLANPGEAMAHHRAVERESWSGRADAVIERMAEGLARKRAAGKG